MDAKTIEKMILSKMPETTVSAKGDDGVHFEAIVVSSAFDGLNPVKRQQIVYAALGDLISSGQVHALELKTYTPDEQANISI